MSLTSKLVPSPRPDSPSSAPPPHTHTRARTHTNTRTYTPSSCTPRASPVTLTVGTALPGKYVLRYAVTDPDGAATTANLTVYVERMTVAYYDYSATPPGNASSSQAEASALLTKVCMQEGRDRRSNNNTGWVTNHMAAAGADMLQPAACTPDAGWLCS